MGCVKTSGRPATLNLTWAADAKGYNPTELALLVGYIDQTLAWLDTIGWVEGDVCAYRVGMPVLKSTANSELEELYTVEVSATDYIINGLSVDMIKITAKGVAVAGVDRVARYEGYNDTYTYKSQYHHEILANYFIDGVNNATRYITPARTIDVWESEPIVIPEIVHNEKYIYIDEPEYDCNKNALAGLRAEYDGVRQMAYTPKELPDYVVKCFNMIAQNFRLLGEFSDTETGKKGDIVYLSIANLKYKLQLAKDKSNKEAGTFFGEYYEDLQYILEYAGMHQAFKDVQYGGQIEKLDLVMRIPASWENEKALKGLIEDKEVALHYGIDLAEVNESHRQGFFNYVFDPRMIAEDAFSSTAITEHVQREHLLDVDRVNEALTRVRLIDNANYEQITNDDLWTINQWFTTDNGYTKSQIEVIKTLGANYSRTKGCKYSAYYPPTPAQAAYTDEDGAHHEAIEATPGEWSSPQYRHWYIRASWIDRLDYSRAAIVFWMGLDLSTSSYKRCRLDQIIIIIIILVITYLSAGAAASSGAAYANYYAAAIAASGVISIGLTLGAFGTGKGARNMAILAALLSLGGSYGNVAAAAGTNVATQAGITFALQVAGTGLAVYQTIENFKFNEEIAELTAELAILNATSMYESDLRFMYEDSYRLPYIEAYKDPHQPIRDMFKPFSSYPNSIGFQEI